MSDEGGIVSNIYFFFVSDFILMIAVRGWIYLCLEEIIELNFESIFIFAYTLNLIAPVDYSYEHKC